MFIKFAALHLQQVGLKKQKAAVDRSLCAKEIKLEDAGADVANADAAEKGSEEQQQMDSDEAKQIAESITDSITNSEKPDVEESAKVY